MILKWVERIEQWARENLPDTYNVPEGSLAGGSEAEGVFPGNLPESYKQLLAARGGMFTWALDNRFPELAGEEAAIAHYQQMGGYGGADSHAEAYEERAFDASKVKQMYWNPLWWPFANGSAGEYLALDMDPGPEGRPGQVIYWEYGLLERTVVASSLEAWLAARVEALESGAMVYSESEKRIVPRAHQAESSDVDAMRDHVVAQLKTGIVDVEVSPLGTFQAFQRFGRCALELECSSEFREWLNGGEPPSTGRWLDVARELAAIPVGETLEVSDLGRFVMSSREAWSMRSTMTGEMMEIPARTILRFMSSKALKDRLPMPERVREFD